MKNFKHFIVACALWSLAWFGLVQPVTWVANLFAFITWASLLLFICGHYNKESRARIHQSHRDGKHAPVWFDWLTYGAIIILCAAMAHYGKAAAWLFIMSTDLGHREEAKKGEAKP